MQNNESTPANTPAPAVFTVELFAERNPAFSPAALRNLIFKAEPRHTSRGQIPGNGLVECGAILRLGRKVLIDEPRFYEWLREQQQRQAA